MAGKTYEPELGAIGNALQRRFSEGSEFNASVIELNNLSGVKGLVR
jgi:hypothetical protein